MISKLFMIMFALVFFGLGPFGADLDTTNKWLIFYGILPVITRLEEMK